ncbi:MAG TPA: gamma-glutamyltransferase [Solirubrobacterales bacterium]|jgi:gamma-glutamyltranspeptidase/glutathione hydrolase|nr:gamma-glutamyltransferase [Solirubrobacterales bacterium]
MSSGGVVAAGHPLTAEAGARVLREGGNAVDAAVAAVLTSFVTESPLTGMGAGGFMLVHTPRESVLLDFFVAAPGRDGAERGAELVPIPVYFTPESPQIFNVGAASCGVPGTPAGLELALGRFGTVPLVELAAEPARLAREGVEVNPEQAYFLSILDPILTHTREGAAIYAPSGKILAAGERFRFPELGDALERFGSDGSEPFYRGDVAAAISDWVLERGGTLGRADLAAYEAVAREPAAAAFRGREILTNPPPSSGGILIAFALDLLERLGAVGVEEVVGAMEAAQAARTEDFLSGLHEDGFVDRFLDPERLEDAAGHLAARMRAAEGPLAPEDGLGSTTHITAVDADGDCATVTCSNGTGSGLIVPSTGVHVNNMLGEEDLNPHGFHRHQPGRRLPSMMSPTVVLRAGELELGLGSGGSNRIRSAVLQTVLGVVTDGLEVADAVRAPRVHFEAGTVQAEPGVDEEALVRLEQRGYEVFRWRERNVFFGGVHAVARDPATGELRGGGDPRRGGAVAVA